MTTGNKLWAIGRAVERALADKDSFAVWQHRDGSDLWAVRTYVAADPRDFVRSYMVTCTGHTATVHPYS